MDDAAKRKLIEYERLYEQWRVAAKRVEDAELSILRDELAGKLIDNKRRVDAAALAAEARRLLQLAIKADPMQG